MSLLNAWVAPTAAVLAVDSIAARADGSPYACAKLQPVPHLGSAAIACRGQAAFFQGLTLRALGAGIASFDELLELMPGLLEELIEQMPPHLLVNAPHVSSGNVVVVAGWSEEREVMRGQQFVQRAEGEAFSAEDFTTLLAPWPPALQHLPTTSAAVESIARAQVQWMRSTYPGAACGGKIVICRLTRAGIELVRRPLEIEAMAA